MEEDETYLLVTYLGTIKLDPRPAYSFEPLAVHNPDAFSVGALCHQITPYNKLILAFEK